MEAILHVFSDNIALLYEETILTFTMIMGAAFISLVAGILSSKILSVMGESEVLRFVSWRQFLEELFSFRGLPFSDSFVS